MTATSALQDWLAQEHQAVWLHPVIGARFDGLADRARTSYTAHRNTRDKLLARLHALDVEPVPTALSYAVGRLRSEAQAERAARRVERAIAAACLRLVGESTGEIQAYAVAGLRRASLAELTWGGPARAFPGLPPR